MSHEIPKHIYAHFNGDGVYLRGDAFLVPPTHSPLGYKFYAGLALSEYRKGAPLNVVYMLAKSALGQANRLKCPRRKAACLKVLGIIRRHMALSKNGFISDPRLSVRQATPTFEILQGGRHGTV